MSASSELLIYVTFANTSQPTVFINSEI